MGRKNFFAALAFAATVPLFVGCQHVEPIYSVSDGAVPASEKAALSLPDIRALMTKVALAEGWAISDVGEDHLLCTRRWQNHAATVRIAFSDKTYSITLVSSENLNAKDGVIHPKYNAYVHRLRSVIDLSLSHAVFS